MCVYVCVVSPSVVQCLARSHHPSLRSCQSQREYHQLTNKGSAIVWKELQLMQTKISVCFKCFQYSSAIEINQKWFCRDLAQRCVYTYNDFTVPTLYLPSSPSSGPPPMNGTNEQLSSASIFEHVDRMSRGADASRRLPNKVQLIAMQPMPVPPLHSTGTNGKLADTSQINKEVVLILN